MGRMHDAPLISPENKDSAADVVAKLHIQGPKQHRNYEGRQWVKPQGSQDTYG